MMTFSGAHQRRVREGERGVQATDRVPLLLALLPKKICASHRVFVNMCVDVCWVGGDVLFFLVCVFFFPVQTDRGSLKINNVSVPPEVLNSGVQKEEKKHNTTF